MRERDTIGDLLPRARAGDAEADRRLERSLYDELRALARSLMRGQAPDHTLQPTALVHEALLKTSSLVAGLGPADRAHLFRTIARAMRQLLVDTARRKATEKHGGGRLRLGADQIDSIVETECSPRIEPESFVQLAELIDELAVEDPQAAEVVRLRTFAGCTMGQVAEIVGISERTAHREWDYARRWLAARLRD